MFYGQHRLKENLEKLKKDKDKGTISINDFAKMEKATKSALNLILLEPEIIPAQVPKPPQQQGQGPTPPPEIGAVG